MMCVALRKGLGCFPRDAHVVPLLFFYLSVWDTNDELGHDLPNLRKAVRLD